MRGKNYELRKKFLEEVVSEETARYLLLQQAKVKALDFALSYYGVGMKAQSQGQIAKRYSVAKPFVSQEVAVILCFLGMCEDWGAITTKRVVTLNRRFFPEAERRLSKKEKRRKQRKTESERLKLLMGWSDIPPHSISPAEQEFCLHLIELYEEGKLAELKQLRHGDGVYLAIVLKYGLDAAGCYRETNEVAHALDLTIPAVDSRLRKGRSYIERKFPQSTAHK